MKLLSKKLFLTPFLSIFVLFTITILSSGCKKPTLTPPQPEVIYNLNYVSPTTGDVYTTDMDELSETIDPETVDINIEISGNKTLKTLGIQIRNSNFQIVYYENYTDVQGQLSYNIETTFLTNIAGFYRIYVISTYTDGSLVTIDPMIFEYRIPDVGGN